MDYASRKDAFHKGNNGSDLLRIHLVTSVAIISHLLYVSVPLQIRQRLPQLALGYIVYGIPLILATTWFSESLLSLNIAVAVLTGIVRIAAATQESYMPARTRQVAHATERRAEFTKLGAEARHKPAFVTVYRAQMMLITIICILAVDFPVFPREFGKCEAYGTSLMDIGVGSFAFALGLVTPQPLVPLPIGTRLKRSTQKSAPLLILSLMRVLAVKTIDYPEQIQEYGLHWNFFTTLAVLSAVGTIGSTIGRFIPLWSAAILLTAGHQIALATGLSDLVANAPRVNLWSANKEGLSSLPGYIAIHWLGMALGQSALDRDSKPGAGLYLPTASLVFSLIFAGLYGHLGLPVSRQLANLPYVSWMAAFNTTFLWICREVSNRDGSHKAPTLLDALNANGLLIFLVANLVTGAINLLMPTIDVSDAWAVCIIALYVGAICAMADMFFKYRQ